MILSMTGFGKYIANHELCDIKVEIKSVNSKFLDPHIRLPRGFSLLEIPIRTILTDTLLRGKVDVLIDVRQKAGKGVPSVNQEMLNRYLGALNCIRSEAKIEAPVTLDHLLRFPDIVEVDADDSFEQTAAPLVLDAVRECARLVNQMREEEGKNLQREMQDILSHLAGVNEYIDENRKYVYEYWLERFRKRMSELEVDVTEERIVQEAAVLAERADISEEVARLRSHIAQFTSIMQTEGQCGKKLDFLCQELNRECNTIGSKSSKIELINAVVEAKSDVDRLREQVQNIV